MKLSCVFAPLMDTPDHGAVAEKLGFERAWIFDTPQEQPGRSTITRHTTSKVVSKRSARCLAATHGPT